MKKEKHAKYHVHECWMEATGSHPGAGDRAYRPRFVGQIARINTLSAYPAARLLAR